MARVANVHSRGSSTAKFASGLENIFKVSTVKVFLALLRRLTMKSSGNAPSTELHLISNKFRYLMGV